MIETEEDVVRRFTDTGALITNVHVRFTGGMDSEIYVSASVLAMHATVLQEVADEIADRHRDTHIDAVIAPAMGGVTLGTAVAYALSERFGCLTVVPSFIATRPPLPGTRLALKRGFPKILPGKHVVILSSGAGVEDQLVALAQGYGATVDCTILLTLDNKDDPFAYARSTAATIRRRRTPNVVLVGAPEDMPFGHALALAMGPDVLCIFAERPVDAEANLTFSDDALEHLSGKHVLGVDGVVTTGKSFKGLIRAAERCGAIVEACTVLWCRGDFRDPRFSALVMRAFPTYPPGPDTCPPCRAGKPYSDEFGHG